MCSINCSGGCIECSPEEHFDVVKVCSFYGKDVDDARSKCGTTFSGWVRKPGLFARLFNYFF